MQPIVDQFNSLIRPALRNYAAADADFVAAQAAGTGVYEARQAVMLAARQAAIELHHFADFVLTNLSPPVVFADLGAVRAAVQSICSFCARPVRRTSMTWRSSGTSRARSNITSSTGRVPPSRAPKRSSGRGPAGKASLR